MHTDWPDAAEGSERCGGVNRIKLNQCQWEFYRDDDERNNGNESDAARKPESQILRH